jgi:DNA-directed RNA polymerase specialized sigma24 family protein
MPGKTDTNSIPADTSRFATTHWSLVLAAGSPESTRYHEALEVLCRTYWFPIYAYLRRQGHAIHQSEDHTQGFFTHMIEMRDLQGADPERGRFRSFLLSMLKHFVADQRIRSHAQKRGGGKKILSLDFADAETRYKLEPAHQLSPDKLFEKSWAFTVLSQTMAHLKAETSGTTKQKLFEQLKAHLGGQSHAVPYRELAAGLDMTEGAVKVALFRLRQRYRALLHEQIAQTVSTAEEIEDEIQALFTALSY